MSETDEYLDARGEAVKAAVRLCALKDDLEKFAASLEGMPMSVHVPINWLDAGAIHVLLVEAATAYEAMNDRWSKVVLARRAQLPAPLTSIKLLGAKVAE